MLILNETNYSNGKVTLYDNENNVVSNGLVDVYVGTNKVSAFSLDAYGQGTPSITAGIFYRFEVFDDVGELVSILEPVSLGELSSGGVTPAALEAETAARIAADNGLQEQINGKADKSYVDDKFGQIAYDKRVIDERLNDAYTKEQVDGFIRNWSGYVVIPFGQQKPSASDAQLGKIYLVQVSNDPDVRDQYEEWISDGTAWSLIGTMAIDLSPYDKIVDAEAREKAISDALAAHISDPTKHITAAERTKWNAAVQPSQLATVATTGSYNDLTGKPTIPPAITVDSAMSSTSTNPVQNRVVNTALSSNSTTDRLYANHQWGGDFRTTLSPMDNYLFMSRNCFFGINIEGITIEYSNDGGESWEDYGLTDAQKKSFFSQFGSTGIYCGKAQHVHAGCTASAFANVPHDLDDSNVALQRLRITVNCCNASGTQWLYCNLRRIGMYISTQSATPGTHCVFEARTKADYSAGNDVWRNYGDFRIAGDSGWNSIPCNNATSSSGSIRFGNGNDSYYREVRWTIWSDKLIASPNYSQTGCVEIFRICAFSELLWTNSTTVPNMGNYGVPYSVHPSTGVTDFSKGVSVGSTVFPIANGGTGASTAIGAEYNLLNHVENLDGTLSDTRRFAILNQTKSATNGVFRWYSLQSLWNWIATHLGSLATKSSVTDSDISGTIADSHIASASTWNGKQDALSFTTPAEITEIIGGLE